MEERVEKDPTLWIWIIVVAIALLLVVSFIMFLK
jgi:flagellar basal body-associated protein FliL